MSPKPDPQLQAMPLDRSILWNPSMPGVEKIEGATASRAPYPIFFQQEAVIALQEHVKGSPTQAIFGFLVGELYRDPETGALYSIIDKTLKLSQTIYGDKTEVVVGRLWDRMQEQLAKAHGTLLGWYHSHPGQGGLLTAHDIETHQKFFTDPWHVAILVAAEAGGVTGKFFRLSQSDDWHKTPLPFYELLQPESIKPDGKKRSFIMWRNYKAFGPSLKGPKPKPPEPEPAPEPEPEPPPPPKAKEKKEKEKPKEEKGFRIMRSSADDIPVIKSSADDEPAPPPRAEPPPPPAAVPPPPPPPPPPPAAKARPAAPVFVPDEPREPKRPPAPPPAPPPPPPPPPEPPRKLTSSDELPWQVTPESVASIPPALAAPPPLPAAPRGGGRRTAPHAFRLLDHGEKKEEKKRAPKSTPRRATRRGPWLKRLVILLLVAGVAGGGYWYYGVKNPRKPPPWAGLVEKAKKLVARSTQPPARRSAPPPSRRSTASAPPAPQAAAPIPPPVAPAQPPPPPPVASPFARFDRLGDSLARTVRTFQDRAALFDGGRMDCNGLASGLVAVENTWSIYSAERTARLAALDQPRVVRDQTLYASVDVVSRRFENSGCPRP